MDFDIPEPVRRRAKTPHEISMLNLAFFNLLLGAGTVVLLLTHTVFLRALGGMGFLLPLVASLSVILFLHVQAHRARRWEPWFVAAHWQIAMHRSRLLLIAYTVTGLIVAAGVLIASGIDKRTMREIVETIATRLGAVPTLLMVLACFVLESGSLYQAGRGEVPEGVVKCFPPPAEMRPNETHDGPPRP
jgi:hypothetical protein